MLASKTTCSSLIVCSNTYKSTIGSEPLKIIIQILWPIAFQWKPKAPASVVIAATPSAHWHSCQPSRFCQDSPGFWTISRIPPGYYNSPLKSRMSWFNTNIAVVLWLDTVISVPTRQPQLLLLGQLLVEILSSVTKRLKTITGEKR